MFSCLSNSKYSKESSLKCIVRKMVCHLRKRPTGRLSPCLWGPELGFTVNTPPSLPGVSVFMKHLFSGILKTSLVLSK